MWQFLLLTALFHTMGVASRPIESLEATVLLPHDIAVREIVRQLRSANDDEEMQQRYPSYKSPYLTSGKFLL